jgi:hypothetical protein
MSEDAGGAAPVSEEVNTEPVEEADDLEEPVYNGNDGELEQHWPENTGYNSETTKKPQGGGGPPPKKKKRLHGKPEPGRWELPKPKGDSWVSDSGFGRPYEG